MRALDLKQQGWKQSQIASTLGATPGAVRQWLAAARAGQREALRAHRRPGSRPKLAPEQVRLIPDFLWHGPEAYGFPGEIWTCDRVAGVLWEEFGVWYSRSQVSRILKRLGWTPQIPISRAIQRDEEAIERCRVETWPVLRVKARRDLGTRETSVDLRDWENQNHPSQRGYNNYPSMFKVVAFQPDSSGASDWKA